MAITIQDVRDLLPAWASDAITDDAIQMAIDASKCLLDQFSASYCGASFSDNCLDMIHTYLACHFLSVSYPSLALSSESSSDCCTSNVKYSYKFGDGILSTSYGIMANTLSGGCLAEFDKQPANLFSIGTHGGDVRSILS